MMAIIPSMNGVSVQQNCLGLLRFENIISSDTGLVKSTFFHGKILYILRQKDIYVYWINVISTQPKTQVYDKCLLSCYGYKSSHHEPWCWGFQTFVIMYLHTTASSFCDWFWQITLCPCGGRISSPPPPTPSHYCTNHSQPSQAVHFISGGQPLTCFMVQNSPTIT
jgi:hypothetical protein